MISGKINFFLVFVCILGKCSGKYSTLCVWSNVKQNNKKNLYPKPSESTKNGNHHCQPPKPTPQPTVSQTPTEIDPKPTLQPTETHCTKPKIKLQINQIPSISTHRQQLNPSPATIKPIMADLVNLKNKNPDFVLVFLASSRHTTPRQASPCLTTPRRAVLRQRFELLLTVRLGFVWVRDWTNREGSVRGVVRDRGGSGRTGQGVWARERERVGGVSVRRV